MLLRSRGLPFVGEGYTLLHHWVQVFELPYRIFLSEWNILGGVTHIKLIPVFPPLTRQTNPLIENSFSDVNPEVEAITDGVDEFRIRTNLA